MKPDLTIHENSSTCQRARDRLGARQILGGLGRHEGDSLVGATARPRGRVVVARVRATNDCVRGDGTPQGRPLRSRAVVWR